MNCFGLLFYYRVQRSIFLYFGVSNEDLMQVYGGCMSRNEIPFTRPILREPLFALELHNYLFLLLYCGHIFDPVSSLNFIFTSLSSWKFQ